MTLLVGPATVITFSAGRPVVEQGGVLIEGDRVGAVGPYEELRDAHPGARVVDAGGGVVIPGLTNAHMHLYGLFARGFDFGPPPPRSFRQVLERVWWRLDRALTREAVRLCALYGLADCLRCGVTAVNDHHASPGAIPGILDEIAGAATTLGVRVCLAYEVTDRHGPEGARAGIDENVRFIEAAASAGPLVAARFGLHASFTLSDETLQACRRAAEGLGGRFPGFHVHLAEGPEDPADSLLRSGRRTVHRLAAAGILGPRTFAAHAVHLDAEEVALLSATGTVVTHQPHSNMANAVGWARILAMRERGVRVALGTDGYTCDMLETLRTAAALHSHSTATPSAGVADFTDILLRANPSLLGELWGVSLGRLEPGAAADLVVSSYRPPTPLTAENAAFHLFYGMSVAHVESVVVAGLPVMENRRIVGIDEAELAREARRVASAVWARIEAGG